MTGYDTYDDGMNAYELFQSGSDNTYDSHTPEDARYSSSSKKKSRIKFDLSAYKSSYKRQERKNQELELQFNKQHIPIWGYGSVIAFYATFIMFFVACGYSSKQPDKDPLALMLSPIATLLLGPGAYSFCLWKAGTHRNKAFNEYCMNHKDYKVIGTLEEYVENRLERKLTDTEKDYLHQC